MDCKEIIHVGYPKAASTTLQNNIFAHHPDISYLGIAPSPNNVSGSSETTESGLTPYCLDAKLREFHRRLVFASPVTYDPDQEAQTWAKLRERWGQRDQQTVVFSNERISSVYYALDDLQLKIDRVAKVFNNPSVIIIIRRQLDIIRSQYRDQPFDPRDLEEGRPVSFDDWFCLLREDERFIDSLKYNRVVRMYEEKLGEANVYVFPFEQLVDDVEQAAISLYECMGLESNPDFSYDKRHENPSPSPGYFAYKQAVRSSVGQTLSQVLSEGVKNKIHNIFKSALGGYEKKKIEVDPEVIKKIKILYSEENEKISDRYGLNLDKHGYF